MAKIQGEEKANIERSSGRRLAAELEERLLGRLEELADRYGLDRLVVPTRLPAAERARICSLLRQLVDHPAWDGLRELAEYERYTLADAALMPVGEGRPSREQVAGQVLGMFHLIERAEAAAKEWTEEQAIAEGGKRREEKGAGLDTERWREDMLAFSGAEAGGGDLASDY